MPVDEELHCIDTRLVNLSSDEEVLQVPGNAGQATEDCDEVAVADSALLNILIIYRGEPELGVGEEVGGSFPFQCFEELDAVVGHFTIVVGGVEERLLVGWENLVDELFALEDGLEHELVLVGVRGLVVETWFGRPERQPTKHRLERLWRYFEASIGLFPIDNSTDHIFSPL